MKCLTCQGRRAGQSGAESSKFSNSSRHPSATHPSFNGDGLELKSHCTSLEAVLLPFYFLIPPSTMSLNGLTGSAGLKLGPLVLETIVKHYFERLKASQKISSTVCSDGAGHDGKLGGSVLNNNLRQEELLYDQAFTIVKVSGTRVLSPDRPLHSRARRPFVFGYVLLLPVADPRDLIAGLLGDLFSVSRVIVQVYPDEG